MVPHIIAADGNTSSPTIQPGPGCPMGTDAPSQSTTLGLRGGGTLAQQRRRYMPPCMRRGPGQDRSHRNQPAQGGRMIHSTASAAAHAPVTSAVAHQPPSVPRVTASAADLASSAGQDGRHNPSKSSAIHAGMTSSPEQGRPAGGDAAHPDRVPSGCAQGARPSACAQGPVCTGAVPSPSRACEDGSWSGSQGDPPRGLCPPLAGPAPGPRDASSRELSSTAAHYPPDPSSWNASTKAAQHPASTWAASHEGDRVAPRRPPHAVALDCEMVGVGCNRDQHAVVRVCVVDEEEHVLLDAVVCPAEPITDYRFEFTGLTPDQISCGISPESARAAVLAILGERSRYSDPSAHDPAWGDNEGGHPWSCLLVGHDLEHDLEALGLKYPLSLWRDTAWYTPLVRTSGGPHKLRYLTSAYLGYDIQTEGQPHDAAADCIASMRLYLRMRDHCPGQLAATAEFPEHATMPGVSTAATGTSALPSANGAAGVGGTCASTGLSTGRKLEEAGGDGCKARDAQFLGCSAANSPKLGAFNNRGMTLEVTRYCWCMDVPKGSALYDSA
eukprot:jgi/Mesvir1/17226/Mv07640-RA.1